MSVPREVSPNELAAVLGLTSRALGKLAEKGIFSRLSRGRYDLAVSVQAYTAYREKLVEQRVTGGDGSYAQGRAKKVWEEARKVEHERVLREGRFMPVSEFRIPFESFLAIIRTMLLALPSKVGSRLHGRYDHALVIETAEVVKALVYELLTRVSKMTTNEVAKHFERQRRRNAKGDAEQPEADDDAA
jgi:hypothetical protein